MHKKAIQEIYQEMFHSNIYCYLSEIHNLDDVRHNKREKPPSALYELRGARVEGGGDYPL